jgi:hypothetical protein
MTMTDGRPDTLRVVRLRAPGGHGGEGAVVVAAPNPAVCRNRVIPARWKLTLKPTRDEALIHLLASPI